jgi:ABC-type uncharacterized transport system permease subunit
MLVLGRVPNIEQLERMILLGIRAGFVLITIGLIIGMGLVSVVGTGIVRWLTDLKVICIIAAWVLLGIILLLNRLLLLKGKVRAYMTIAVFVFVLFAILAATFLGTTHDFNNY